MNFQFLILLSFNEILILIILFYNLIKYHSDILDSTQRSSCKIVGQQKLILRIIFLILKKYFQANNVFSCICLKNHFDSYKLRNRYKFI